MLNKELILIAVFAVPMFTLLFTSCFKLDELIAKPKGKKKFTRRRTFRPRMPGLDSEGLPVCKDPGTHVFGPKRKAA